MQALGLTPAIAVCAFALGYSLTWALLKGRADGSLTKTKVLVGVRAASRWLVFGRR